MLQMEHSAIFSTFIKLPFVIKIFVLSIFEWLLKTGFTVSVSKDVLSTGNGDKMKISMSQYMNGTYHIG